MPLSTDDGHQTQLTKLQMVADDPAAPDDIVDHARRLLATTSHLAPEIIEDRIEDWSDGVIGNISPHSPAEDYVRCISYHTLFEHYIQPTAQNAYGTSDEYLQYLLEVSHDPTSTILSDLRRPILVPARYSWLIPASELTSNEAVIVKQQLQILSDPPYLVMEFSSARMIQCGLDVRQPCSIDAIRTSQFQWTPNGVPKERIDGDIPFVALRGLRWIE